MPSPDSRKLRERPLQRIATPGGTNGLNTDKGEPAAERTAHGGSGKTPGGRPSKPGPVSRSIGTTWQPVHRRDSLSTGHSSAGSGTDGILPTTTPADQKSSMGAAWPETEASRASLVTNGAPSFSASTM